MATNITTLKDKNGNNLYPVTSTNAVLDSNGVSIEDKKLDRTTGIQAIWAGTQAEYNLLPSPKSPTTLYIIK